jgi:hypothetical protein
MTIGYYGLKRVAIGVLFALALIACTVPVSVAAQSSPALNKKEFKLLLVSARTSADEQKLVSYYRAKAERLTIKSQDFAKQADFLATQPATIESKQGISCNCASHYRYFSKEYAREAKEAEALAAKHEQLVRNYAAGAPGQK